MAKKSSGKKPEKQTATRGAKKKAAKPASRKKPARTKKKAAAKKRKRLPRGYLATSGGLLIPAEVIGEVAPVQPAKIRSGLEKARMEIQKLMEALSELTHGYKVSEIELAVSFSADGKFLGIGVGGATAIKVRFRPDDSEDGD